MQPPSDFFAVGGTLRPQVPSYVRRPADAELLARVLAGEFCYVLTARQMGKSSLMVRVARQLTAQQHHPVIVDLTAIGTADSDAWYLGIIRRVQQTLRLPTVDVETWWNERNQRSQPQRFAEFLREVALPATAQRLILFIDEIDSTLNLPFRDDFFAAIRAIYQARADEPIYERLSVVLLGAATPTDLIQDRARTPFNIGRRVVLQEFRYAEAQVLEAGLEAAHPGDGAMLLQRIFHWTNGHPYLTQKLCLIVAQDATSAWNEQTLDALIATTFFTEEARKDSNIAMVRDRIAATPPGERRRMLRLYQAVLDGKRMPDDDRSPIQNRLELYGLLGVERGYLMIRNRIYQRVFDRAWIRANRPVNPGVVVSVLAVISAVFVLLLAAYLLQDRRPDTLRANECTQTFQTSSSNTERMQALECLFTLGKPQFDTRALELFYSLDQAEQRRFFRVEDPATVANALFVVAGKVAPTLPDITTADGSGYDYDQEILESMADALDRLGRSDAKALGSQLRRWINGRQAAEQGDWVSATALYSQVLAIDSHNVAAYYDRAAAHLAQGHYEAAQNDVAAIVTEAETWQAPEPTATQEPEPTVTIEPPPQLLPPVPTNTPIPSSTPVEIANTAASQTSTAVGAVHTAVSAASPFQIMTATPVQATIFAPVEFTLFTSRERILTTVRKFVASNPPLWIPALVTVPAGPFLMGSSDSDTQALSDEKPQHTVDLPAYWIGKTEVTNGQFRLFVEGDGYTNRAYWSDNGWAWRQSNDRTQPYCWDVTDLNGDNQPVVCITWYEAAAYCTWLSVQTGQEVRLPTEAEWEKAARGTDGRIYPWGNTWEVGRANSNEAGIGKPSAVGSYPSGASPYGALDMAGNAWEWTRSAYEAYPYDPNDGREDLRNPAQKRFTLRGGSWNVRPFFLRASSRGDFAPGGRVDWVGFRVSRYP